MLFIFMRYFMLICFLGLYHLGYSQLFNLSVSISNIEKIKSELNIGVFNQDSTFLKIRRGV